MTPKSTETQISRLWEGLTGEHAVHLWAPPGFCAARLWDVAHHASAPEAEPGPSMPAAVLTVTLCTYG